MSEYVASFEHESEGWYELREEIVRCRDCKKLNIVGECPCGFWALENLNGFCAWASRKEVGE